LASGGSPQVLLREERGELTSLTAATLALLALLAMSAGVHGQAGGASFVAAPCPFWSAAKTAQYRVECGRLSVPDRAGGQRRWRLQIAVLRSLAERRHNDAIVVIPGGPGEEIVGPAAAQLAQHPLQDTLRQHRDIVLLDPRGVGYSDPGELCPTLAGMDVRLDMIRLSHEERTARVRRELAQCRARLLQEAVDPAQFNSVAAARDLEHMRRALGYDRLNLIGLSWGTRVALEMMRRFPTSVRSALLYGPFAPDAWVPNARGLQGVLSLERLLHSCTQDAACRAEFPSLVTEFTALRGIDPIRLHARGGPIDIDGVFALNALMFALYDSDFLPYIPLAIRELRRGNASFVQAVLASAVGQGSSGGFYYAAQCYELAPPLERIELARLAGSHAWTPEIDRFAPDPATVCNSFVGPSRDPTVLQPVWSGVPTLIFVGEFDPTTPPASGRRIAATLSSAHLIVLPARGHDVNVPNPCTAQIRQAFLDNPERAPDTSCVAALPPLRFATDVYVNTGVPRLLVNLVFLRDARWIAGIALLVLSLSLAVMRLPARLLGRQRDRRVLALLATGVLWAGAGAAIVFAIGLVAALRTGGPYVGLFGVPAAWKWLFTLPKIVAVLTAISVPGLIVSWRPAWWWNPRDGALRIFALAALVAFVVFTYQVELLQL
jgi:pimeloyl-ACP methyl ester carboxylesterase